MKNSVAVSDQLLDLLQNRQNRKHFDDIALLVIDSPELIQKLFEIAISQKTNLGMRASWVLDIVSQQRPKLLEPIISQVLPLLENLSPSGNKRNFMKIISKSAQIEKLGGPLLDIAFKWASNPEIPAAVRVHSIETIYRFAHAEPDIIPELILILEDIKLRGSNAEKAKARNTLKLLEKLKKL